MHKKKDALYSSDPTRRTACIIYGNRFHLSHLYVFYRLKFSFLSGKNHTLVCFQLSFNSLGNSQPERSREISFQIRPTGTTLKRELMRPVALLVGKSHQRNEY